MNFANVKSITIPEGKVKQILSGNTILWKSGPTNLLSLATDTDRETIYNKVGYANSKRWSSSGKTIVNATANMGMTGFIPCQRGDILRVRGFEKQQNTSFYIIAFDDNNNIIHTLTLWQSSFLEGGISGNDYESPGYFAIELTNEYFVGFTAVRLSIGAMSADTIITINEEIPT